MSTDEQMILVGRLTMEKAEANRQRALLGSELRKLVDPLQKLASCLTQPDDETRMGVASVTLEELISKGSLEHVRQLVSEVQEAVKRTKEISKTLREAGAE